jgi:hypothetical protein
MNAALGLRVVVLAVAIRTLLVASNSSFTNRSSSMLEQAQEL